ncbi:MAG: hypothetical protein QNK40_08075 [Desulfobacterales bacterium]|nr:hypothetical protein [Desulfobacterales bacterium]MDX2509128.1 hypothetical protein [Desulfobacterales bacterium]
MRNYTKIFKIFNLVFTLLVFGALLFGLVFSGCGKKCPPEIIKKSVKKLAPVNLKYQIQGSNILLQWKSDYQQKIDGFGIFMAKQNIKECQGCPVVFERIDYLPPELNQYKKELKKGYRYFFKIKTVSTNNISSKDSETVEIEFK